MAEVHVTSWTEFLQAIQVSGDDVHCPDGAIWDMNELEPDGHVGTIRFDCSNVFGHNTAIKNLKYDGRIEFNSSFVKITDLHWENMLANQGTNGSFFWRDGNPTTVESLSRMELCRISGYFTKTNGGTIAPCFGFYCYRCGFNFEVVNCSAFQLPSVMEYCNLIGQAPNASTISYHDVGWSMPFFHKFSNIVVVAPNATRDTTTTKAEACCFRGRKERLQSFYFSPSSTYPCLYCSTDMDAITYPNGMTPVTEAQLRDASYLQSIGFPIGV